MSLLKYFTPYLVSSLSNKKEAGPGCEVNLKSSRHVALSRGTGFLVGTFVDLVFNPRVFLQW